MKILLLLLCLLSSKSWAASSEDLLLRDLLKHYTEVSAAIDPFLAPRYGVKGYETRLGDFASKRFVKSSELLWSGVLTELSKIDFQKLSSASKIDYQTLNEQLSNLIVASSHEGHWYMNFSHKKNRFIDFQNQADPDQGAFAFQTFEDYLNFAKRMKAFRIYARRLIDIEREGIAKGYRLSCYSVEKISGSLVPAVEKNLDRNPFWKPLLSLPKNLSPNQIQQLQTIYTDVIQNEISEAYTDAIHFVDDEYTHHCVEKTGYSETANGQQ